MKLQIRPIAVETGRLRYSRDPRYKDDIGPQLREALLAATEGPHAPSDVVRAAASKKLDEATERVTELGKFTEERAQDLGKNVAEQRAREKRMAEISGGFMAKLGKQLGYGHPLAEVTSQHKFTWTDEAEAELKDVPAFCREMTKWRVEWTAVKMDLGTVITPEIMSVKYSLWGEVSEDFMNREGSRLTWAPETEARLDRIPDFVKGQVIESIEGNARKWGVQLVDNSVLERVIQKWIDTGDFHEQTYGYK